MTLMGKRAGWILALVTIGLGLNLRASILLGPHLHDRFGVGPGRHLALVGLPVLVAALARLPVGVLTDRHGVRVMLPAVSLVAAASVIALGLAGSLPWAVAAGATAGTASSAFVVGAAQLSLMSPYGRRGLMLGIFGLGVALAVVISAVSWSLDRDGRLTALVLGALLIAFAIVVTLVIREPAPGDRSGSPLRDCAALVRLAATSPVSLLYVVALGGMLSIAVFLPDYLVTALDFDWTPAMAITGAVAIVAAVARLAGGRLTDRRPTPRLLVTCYGIAAALCLVITVAPGHPLAVAAIAGLAACDGVAGGALLALIGKSARPHNAGAVMGVTGAAGALGALVPPLLLTGLHRLGWVVMAAVLLGAMHYVRRRDLHVGLGLALGFRPAPSPTATTVAILGARDTRLGAAAVVAGLAELATSDELIVVYGLDERLPLGLTAADLAAGLRFRLPRHSVVAVPVDHRPDRLSRDALLLGEYVDAGTLAIAVTRTASQSRVAADLSIYLQADRVLTISYDPARGPVVT